MNEPVTNPRQKLFGLNRRNEPMSFARAFRLALLAALSDAANAVSVGIDAAYMPQASDYVQHFWQHGAPYSSTDDRFWRYTNGASERALALDPELLEYLEAAPDHRPMAARLLLPLSYLPTLPPRDDSDT